ncbi:MAG: hypothetical protein JWQ38_2755 [Flavipsychrobacter sp.]|nr:hypothetical protein [Flavipsychrobacter sp.]
MATEINFDFIDFDIVSDGSVSQAFKELGITKFHDACKYVKIMPFKRNEDKTDRFCVLKDGYGTCGTKHAVLKVLAMENGAEQVHLKMGIFKMSKTYTHKIAHTLVSNNLEYIPEAHMYLVVDGEIVDCTNVRSSKEDFINELMEEIDIQPDQLINFKVNYHKQFLQKWLDDNKNIKYSLSELFAIREQCIKDLYTD